MRLHIALAAAASLATLAVPNAAHAVQQGFAGPYAPANWTLTKIEGNGSVDTGATPGSLSLTGSNAYWNPKSSNTDYTTTAAAAGSVSFDWNYSSIDYFNEDGFGYLLNGTYTQLSDVSSGASGTTGFNVALGDTFGFRMITFSDQQGPGRATITNFSAPTASVPGPLPLFGAGAAYGWSRRLRRRIAGSPVSQPRP